jgi:cephalosporin hydroxylase
MDEGSAATDIVRLIADRGSPDEIIASYRNALIDNPVLSRLDKALACGVFKDGVGNVEPLGNESITLFQAALINFLVSALKPAVTIETGFGLGVSAIAFLGSTAHYSHKKHFCIDPYGIRGRGAITLNFIRQTSGERFELIKEPSEYALPRLVYSGELSDCSVSLVDGAHLFEIVMADITFLDAATPAGGCMILDDASAPAIEAAASM